jgi:CubicO group peptidase (beta-lactamase class C family)
MISDAIDRLFADWNTTTTPGCALGIVRGGRLLHSATYGIRDIDSPQPIDEDTTFDIASEAKQFTGASILLLANENAVDLQSDVHEVVPELPDYGYRVTLDNLAHHTSGVPEYYDRMAEAGSFEMSCTTADVLEFLTRQRQLDFAPGQRFSYSNSGYVLLALVVERVTGMSFAQFLADRLFRPLGMAASVVCDTPSSDIPGAARGHDRSPEGRYIHREFKCYAVPGPGSLYSTVRDLGRWVAALHEARSEFFDLGQKMLAPGILSSGENTRYGLGLDWGQCFTPPDDLRIVTHSGMHAGFRSVVLRMPDHDLAVILLCNTRDIDHCTIARAIADIMLGG